MDRLKPSPCAASRTHLHDGRRLLTLADTVEYFNLVLGPARRRREDLLVADMLAL